MYEIIERESVKGRPDWMRVVLVDREPIVIPIQAWVDNSLKVGLSLSDADVAMLEDVAMRNEAQEIALRYLRTRARTTAEMRRYLGRKGYSEDIQAAVVQRLCASGLLDDNMYAEAFAQSREASMSRRELAFRLKERGVAPQTVSGVLTGESALDAERAAAHRVAAKYMRSRQQEEWTKVRLKLAAHLQRRGFPQQLVLDLLNTFRPDRDPAPGLDQ